MCPKRSTLRRPYRRDTLGKIHHQPVCLSLPLVDDLTSAVSYDYYATKTGSIIVPQSGYDSIPSDISAFLANKTLKAHSPLLNLGTSTTGHKIRGGVSGGTVATTITAIEEVPSSVHEEASLPHSLSPIVGVKPSQPQFSYNLSIPGGKEIYGAFFFMQPTNRAIVQRTAGLFELEATMHGGALYFLMGFT